MNLILENNIKTYLNKYTQNIDFQIFDTINSTNTYAKEIVSKINKNTIIISNHQTNGKGKFGRSFFSPANTGIYLSIIIKDTLKLSNIFSMTFICAIAVCKTIEKLTNLKPKIKWINDIFINNKKCCGILTECETNFKTQIASNIIVGVGVNIGTIDFPKNLKNIATSLKDNNIDRNEFIAILINNFFELFYNLNNKQIIEEYKKYCFVLGKEILYIKDNIEYSATAIDINEFGNLVVKDFDNKIKILEFEEVSIKDFNLPQKS